jgi:acyl-CoA reductase-like NAD-dependent aldehyde dehydrogenase
VSKPHPPARLDVRKTYTLFINGEFVRSQSGRSDPVGTGTEDFAHVARASREDLREAVASARAAQPKWARSAPSERGLVLYRLAQMMEARRAQFVERIRSATKADEPTALREAMASTDRTLWYAGWADKYAAVVSARNPVAGPYFCYSAPEPMGVVGVIAPDEPTLLGLVSCVVPPLVSGNTVVAVASELDPRGAIEFAECLATCDLPAGAVNLLTGRRIELAPTLARHMDLAALDAYGLDASFAAELERLGTDNLKRTRTFPASPPSVWFSDEAQDLSHVTALTEIKTIWQASAV